MEREMITVNTDSSLHKYLVKCGFTRIPRNDYLFEVGKGKRRPTKQFGGGARLCVIPSEDGKQRWFFLLDNAVYKATDVSVSLQQLTIELQDVLAAVM